MKQYFLGNWSDVKGVEGDFQVQLDKEVKILLAWYGYGDYDGSAFVLYEHNGKLYEVNGGHCSLLRLRRTVGSGKNVSRSVRVQNERRKVRP